MVKVCTQHTTIEMAWTLKSNKRGKIDKFSLKPFIIKVVPLNRTFVYVDGTLFYCFGLLFTADCETL